MNQEKCKVGDIVLFNSSSLVDKLKRIFSKNKELKIEGIGIVISVWGETYIVKVTEHTIQMFPFCGGEGKTLTPKKPYAKEEQEKLSKVVIKEVAKWVEDYYSYINFSWVISEWANLVRPRTFDIQGKAKPLDIESNRYYKVL